MKKNLSFIMMVICAISLQAQVATITPVTYRGAFAPAPTSMWTAGWTNWDPQYANYGSGVDSIIKTPITTNRTLSGTKKYLLQGLVYVTNNAVLTVNAGCIVKGDPNVANSSLIIARGAKIYAIGTATKPIVFTSSSDAGSRSKGDWGGIILLGKAHFNGAGGQNYIEGIAPNPNTQYGGGTNPDDDDISGTLKYVRIEYGGYIYANNQEINGLTMGAVGRGTTIQYVQVSYANDDAYEWFGGTVNCKYLVAYRCLDDNWDTDFGYSGSVQFALGVRDPNISDNPVVSTSEGFESDNDPSSTGNPLLKPYTTALFCNITEIGPLRGDTSSIVASGYRRAVRIRRNSHLRIVNSLLMDHLTGLFIDGINSITAAQSNTVNAGTSNPGNLVFKNNIIAGTKGGRVLETNLVWNMAAWFGANNNDSLGSSAGILTTPYNYTAPDYRPATGSLARVKANFNDSAFYYVDTTGALTSLIACPTSLIIATKIWGATAICPYKTSGDTAKYYLATNVAGVLNYEWTVPAGITIVSGQGTDSLIVTIGNTFVGGNITVRGLSYCGVYSANSKITLTSAPPKPGTITGTTTVTCGFTGTPVTYSINPVIGVSKYKWTLPVGATFNGDSTTPSISVTYSNVVSGKVTVRSDACGLSAASSLNIVRVAIPTGINGAVDVCPNAVVTYTVVDTKNVSGTNYTWTVPSGATFTGQNTNSIEVTFGAAISGTITVRAKGCVNISSNPFSLTLMPGTNCFSGKSSNSITSVVPGKKSLTISPNPASSEFTLNVNGIQSEVPATLQIVNTFGQVVRQETLKTNTGTINRKVSNLNLPAGLYYVKFNNGVENYTQKVVIK